MLECLKSRCKQKAFNCCVAIPMSVYMQHNLQQPTLCGFYPHPTLIVTVKQVKIDCIVMAEGGGKEMVYVVVCERISFYMTFMPGRTYLRKINDFHTLYIFLSQMYTNERCFSRDFKDLNLN